MKYGSYFRRGLPAHERCAAPCGLLKKLLETDNGSSDGTPKNNDDRNICLAFTVDDIEKEYRKVSALGARIIEPPAERPWGAVNMSFTDRKQ